MNKIKRRDVRVGNRIIGETYPTFIVAETGTNHNGNINIALKMVEAAKRVGADAVKFQTIDADASYIKGTAPYKIYKNIKFTNNDWLKIRRAALKNKIIFFSAPADIPSVQIFEKIKIPIIKISSGSMTNIALVRKMSELGIPVMISTGMAYLDEVKTVVREFEKNGIKDIMILHCTSVYPANASQLNLNCIKTLRKNFAYPIGYSDHATSNLPSIIAVCMGAKIIEKHFTIDRSAGGPEQYLSYDMNQFEDLVKDIRYTEKALGSAEKAPSAAELKKRDKARRCLVANRDILKGEFITPDMIGMKRPLQRQGLNTAYVDEVIRKRAKCNIRKNEPIYSTSIGM